MTNYERGRQAEYYCRDYFREKGFYSQRSAGSKTRVDVFVITPEKFILVQVKRSRKNQKFRKSELRDEIKEFRELEVPDNTEKWLFVWKDYNGWILKEKID